MSLALIATHKMWATATDLVRVVGERGETGLAEFILTGSTLILGTLFFPPIYPATPVRIDSSISGP